MEPDTGPKQPRRLGDIAAQAFEQYRAELRRFFTRQARNDQLSDDLVQEVYLQVLRFPPVEVVREPQAYLFRVAWHVANRFNQRRQHDPVSFDSETADGFVDRSPDLWMDDVCDRLAFEQQFERVLGELPDRVQAALILLKRDGLSYKEIAAELSISVHTVKKYIIRAVMHFKNAKWD